MPGGHTAGFALIFSRSPNIMALYQYMDVEALCWAGTFSAWHITQVPTPWNLQRQQTQ